MRFHLVAFGHRSLEFGLHRGSSVLLSYIPPASVSFCVGSVSGSASTTMERVLGEKLSMCIHPYESIRSHRPNFQFGEIFI